MNLAIGIVGLPNVGKSTLFNALTKSAKAAAENFPFCTIDPNTGIVEVPDERIEKLAEIVKPERVMKSTIEFTDIAGLVEGASKGEGLGNQFLSHIRECSAIAHVVRDFESGDIHHVNGSINPKRDLEVIMTELILADLESVTRQLERLGKKVKAGDKEAKQDAEILEKIRGFLEAGELGLRALDEVDEDTRKSMKRLQLLTTKPYLVVANVAEDQFASFDTENFRGKLSLDSHIPIVPICAKLEADLVGMEPEEAEMFLSDIGAKYSGLEMLAKTGFELLGLQQYFTAGVKEVRSWTIYQGDTAPQAAGAIHTDFEKGFIKADTIAYEDFIANEGEAGAKAAGKMRIEGKDYVVKDGDVMHFKFNV